MTALDKLKDDHKLIRRYLDNLFLAHNFLVEREEVPASVFDKTLEFSKKFMNKYHHYREEYVLFLKLAEKKGGTIDPQIVSLRDQHERSRDLVSRIKEALKGYKSGDEVATSRLTENVGYYVSLERQHVNRENHVFYPMAAEAFSADEMGEFDAEFDKIEQKQGPDAFKNGVDLVESIEADMKAKFGAIYRDAYEELVKNRGHND
ncbi:MAG: hemerythrin domain-containing protein [Proteobacteria bacterium]|nr:hemerythrin domain-containing protein [Pseudomonadota bacterium]